MLRLQMYLMLTLHVPNLVWQAIDVAYRLALWVKMQEIAVAAGFKLTTVQNGQCGNILAKEYRYGSMKRFFAFHQNGLVIAEFEEIRGVTGYYDLGGEYWHIQNGLFFFNGNQRSVEEWCRLYQKKTCEHRDQHS